MIPVASLWSFVLVVGLLTLTPGLDTALIVRTAALGKVRGAWGVVLGIQCGTLVWGVLTSAGVTALLTASHLAYEVLRWAGVCYLLWLGLGMLRGAGRGHAPDDDGDRRGHGAGRDGVGSDGFLAGWRRGALTNLLNPKVGAFYVALLPQFIPSGASPLAAGVLLTCVHIALGTAWSTVLVLAARRLRGLLRRPAARRAMDRLAGTVIAAFGIRMALSSR